MERAEQDSDDADHYTSSRKRQRTSHGGAHISISQPQPLSHKHDSSAATSINTLSGQAAHAKTMESMREILTCKVCHRFMYEPYTLSCGHTYCYSCLTNWMVENRKRTCPDCRSVISTQPCPSFVIREMVTQCTTIPMLLPEGETIEEHQEMAREEAEIVAHDKANSDEMAGGLFRGRFRIGNMSFPMAALHDPGDGVDRCPVCHWELEDGYCNQCALPVGDGLSDFDGEDLITDDELDGDLDDENDGESYPWDPQELAIREALFGVHRRRVRNRWRNGPAYMDLVDVDDPDEDEEDSEDEGSMNGFIAGDDEMEDEDDSSASSEESDIAEVGDQTEEIISTARSTNPRPRRRGPMVISSDDESEGVSTNNAFISPERPPQRKVGTARNRPGPLVISSDESSDSLGSSGDDSQGDDDEENDDDGGQAATGTSEFGGFSPMHSSHSEGDSASRSDDEDDDNSDSSDGDGGQTLEDASFEGHYASSSG